MNGGRIVSYRMLPSKEELEENKQNRNIKLIVYVMCIEKTP